MSLRARLLVGMVVLVAAGLGVAALVTYEEQRSFLHTRVQQQVLSAVGPLSGELRLDRLDGRPGLATRRPPAGFLAGRGLTGSHGLAILPPGTFGELRGPGGTVLRSRTFTYDGSTPRNPQLPSRFPVSQRGHNPQLFTIPATGRSQTRYLALAFSVGRNTAIVGVPLREVDQTLHRLIVVEVLVGGGIIVALVVLGWLVIRLGLRPLERIGRVASEIAGGDLSRRVTPSDRRTEVGRLGRSLNEMLHQIEGAFDDRSRSETRLRHFLADASHELRTPLASIRGYAELFRMGATKDPAALQRAMERIEAESIRMGVLVEELLLLAQLDQDPVSREVRVDLRELAEHAVQDTRVIAPERSIELEAGPDDMAVEVFGEPDRLRQLLANLLRNAVIHTPEGTGIEVRLAVDVRWVRLDVRDHGPGLPPGAGEQVFERFWRTEGGRRRGRAGTGLGLAIVKAIVVAHGGTVSASNADGGGAVFRVQLPLAPVDSGSAAAGPLPAAAGPLPAPLPSSGEEPLSADSQPSHGTLSGRSAIVEE
jgi:two-component system, OmpR family, sensor kinase